MPKAFPSSARLTLGAVAALAVLAGLAGSAFFQALPDLCLFHSVTGLPCPTCGLTRSIAAAARLDLAASWRFHPFGAFLLGALVLTPALPWLPEKVRADRRWRWAGALLVAVWCAYALLRMAGVFPPP